MQTYDIAAIKELCKAVSLIETEEECAAFFEDICTIRETLDLAKRLQAAKMLSEGGNYQTIAKEVGISTATISRVSRCIQYGSGGYKLVLDRMKEGEAEK